MKKAIALTVFIVLMTGPLASKEKVAGKYIVKGDAYTYLVLKDDKTFAMQVNLCAGVGDIKGTYTLSRKKVVCTVMKVEFSGFAGDDVKGFTLERGSKISLKYTGPMLGCQLFKDTVFQKAGK